MEIVVPSMQESVCSQKEFDKALQWVHVHAVRKEVTESLVAEEVAELFSPSEE